MSNSPGISGYLTAVKKLPPGILVLLLFIVVELCFMSQLAVRDIPLPVGPVVLSGVVARIYVLLSMMLLIGLCIGLVRKRSWARMLGIVWYLYDIVLAAANYVSFVQSPGSFMDMYQQYKPDDVPMLSEIIITRVLGVNIIFLFISGGIIIGYLYRSKKYFSR